MAQSITPPRWRFWPTQRAEAPDHVAPAVSPSINSRLEIVCCGAFTARCDGQDIVFARSRKARELLAFLATRPGMTASCDDAITALWPAAEPDRARRLLINAAWRIRCALRDADLSGPITLANALRFERSRYTLDCDRCGCDLVRYRAEQAYAEAYLRPYGAATGDDMRQALHEAQRLLELDRLINAPLLAGESFDWLSALERQIRDLRLTTLRRALRLASLGAAQELALSVVERILSLDALDEPTAALAMRLQLARGDSAAAATTYRAFRLALARRYGTAAPTLAQPSQELQALFAQAVGKDGAAREPASPLPTTPTTPPTQAQAPPR